jgi:hypothetical protein
MRLAKYAEKEEGLDIGTPVARCERAAIVAGPSWTISEETPMLARESHR